MTRTSPRSIAYRPDIDGLRAVAVIAVVGYHAFPSAIRGGFAGVDVFFVISGYLISSLIWAGLREGRFTLVHFYARRVLRLFPALLVVLSACLAAGWWLLLPSEFSRLGKDTAAAAVYSSNFVFWRESGYFAADASLRPLTHLWSLAVEEQFYLFYPVLLILVYRSRKWTGVLLLLLLGSSFAVNVARVRFHRAEAFYLLPARFWELLLGGILAYAQIGLHARNSTAGRGTTARLGNAATVAGIALLAVAFFGVSSATVYPGWWALAPTAAGALLVAGGPAAAINRHVLAQAPMVLVGRFSYPLYLWHFPLFAFARVTWGKDLSLPIKLGLVAASVVLAYLTYKLLEIPIRRRVARVSWRPVPAMVALMTVVGCAGLVVTTASGVPARLPFPVQKLTTFSYDYAAAYRESTCFLKPDQDAADFADDCVDRGRRPLLFLWGDSRAADLYPGLKSLQRAKKFRIAEFTASSCPPFVGYSSTDRPFCQHIDEVVLQKVQVLRPTTVVLSAAWEQYPSVSPLADTVAALRRIGIKHIVVVGPVPKWPQGLPQALYDYYQQNHTLPRRLRTELSNAPQAADRVLRPLVKRLRLTYVAPLDLLCNKEGCLARAGEQLDQLTVWDSAHFTDAGSVLFVRVAGGRLLDGIR